MDEGRVVGFVKWFDQERGFGFVRVHGEERDVFVHFSEVLGSGHRALLEGQQVELTLRETPRGLYAQRVVAGDTEGRRVCPRCRHVFCEPRLEEGA